MISNTQVLIVVSLLFQTSQHLSLVRGAAIAQPLTLVPGNISFDVTANQCNEYQDWIGDGINVQDCANALNELYHDDVVPRQGQQYEFLERGVRRVSSFPWVTTPRKHWFGTCVVEIVMLDRFAPGTLPGETSDLPTLKSDTTTFDVLYQVALSVLAKCVDKKKVRAGWSSAGRDNSVGVFIMRYEGVLDRSLTRDSFALEIAGNGSTSSNPFEGFRALNKTAEA